MLESLAVRDIVLIRKLDLELANGLSALTGETGAGKSIILDALGLALGSRGDRGLVRSGAEQGAVTAVFRVPDDHPVRPLLEEQGLEAGPELVVRRLLGADGRSRAFVNDQAVGLGLLRQIGDALVEVHGQFDQQGLLSPASHRRLLDAFGGLDAEVAAVRGAHDTREAARARAEELRRAVDTAEREIEYLQHRERELADLRPEPGEEEALAERRSRLQHRGKLVETLTEAAQALGASGGAVEKLALAQRRVERIAGLDGALVEPCTLALERAVTETAEAEQALQAALAALGDEDESLERIEERLFALRAAARKHRVTVDELPGVLEATREELARIDRAAGDLEATEREVGRADAAYRTAAAALTAARDKAAGALAKAVEAELAPLKLERARFRVGILPLGEAEQGADGAERVQFEVTTNPGQPFGPLTKLASGGELSRFMLALKVVLARLDSAGTLVFDEVDTGIGGATAAAVGERLARLGDERQVLVVTHAPQVAAKAHHHLRVAKAVDGDRVSVDVEELSAAARLEEIARMLAGAAVTEAARAAAASLMRQER
ncbi:MAG: DNA repair protein RecN [Geminicoccaceae bacterium]